MSILSLLLFTFLGSYSYLFSGPVSDGCLRMVYPDMIDDSTGHGGYSNPDSVMIDTCIGSATYNHLFAKKWFDIQFSPNLYPFNHSLDSDEVKGVRDIDSSHLGMLNRFLGLQDTLGLIYFHGYDIPPPDSIVLTNAFIRISFAKDQDIEFIKEHFKNTIDSIVDVQYQNRAMILVGVKEEYEVSTIVVYPNPVKNHFIIPQTNTDKPIKTIEIVSLTGQKVFESDYKDRIDVSQLHSGSYFLRINNQTIKFIKE